MYLPRVNEIIITVMTIIIMVKTPILQVPVSQSVPVNASGQEHLYVMVV